MERKQMSDAKYKALVQLVQDPRIPSDVLMHGTGITEDELIQIVEDTGFKHYRLLGLLPPSELIADLEEYSTVKSFYKALEEADLAKQTETGIIPSDKLIGLVLSVPCYGADWHAYSPAVLDLL